MREPTWKLAGRSAGGSSRSWSVGTEPLWRIGRGRPDAGQRPRLVAEDAVARPSPGPVDALPDSVRAGPDRRPRSPAVSAPAFELGLEPGLAAEEDASKASGAACCHSPIRELRTITVRKAVPAALRPDRSAAARIGRLPAEPPLALIVEGVAGHHSDRCPLRLLTCRGPAAARRRRSGSSVRRGSAFEVRRGSSGWWQPCSIASRTGCAPRIGGGAGRSARARSGQVGGSSRRSMSPPRRSRLLRP